MDFNDFAVLADHSWSLPETQETRLYYLHDALGSVVGLVGGRFQRESDREFYLYDIYGASSDVSACGNPYLFTARRLDILSGGSLKIYHYRTRAYDPATGRFLQTDPIGYADSMNLYEYVGGNPTNYVDPWGLWTYGGMYDAFYKKYGEDGALLLRMANRLGYFPIKQEYRLHDWYYEPGGALGIASRWTDWSWSWPPKIWDYSDETAARQLHQALKHKLGRIAGKVGRCLCQLTITYQYARQVAEDSTGFYEQAGMGSLGDETVRMEADASMLGSHFQNEFVSEAKWALAIFFGGQIAGKSLDAIDDCLDARRIGKAVDLADDVADARKLNRTVRNLTKKQIENARQKGVRQAWKQERDIVRRTKKGTRRWTAAQKRELLETGRVSGYEGHHINSVNRNPGMAGNPNNIEFVTRPENLRRHGGNWRNPTTGPLLDRGTK